MRHLNDEPLEDDNFFNDDVAMLAIDEDNDNYDDEDNDNDDDDDQD